MIRLLLEAVKEWVEELLVSFQTMYLGYVTPQMYGAKADGVTDDTQAIQSAINHGGTIYFPQGTYLVKSGNYIELTKDTRLVGDGRSTIIKTVLKNSFPSEWDKHIFTIKANDLINLDIENISITYDNNIDNIAIPESDSVMLYILGNYNNVNIQNVQLHSGGSANILPKTTLIWLKCGAKSISIKDCLLENFTNNKTGGCIWAVPRNNLGESSEYVINSIIISNNELRNTNGDEAIAIWDSTSNVSIHEVSINDNIIIHNDWNGSSHATNNMIAVYSPTTMKRINTSISNNKVISHKTLTECLIKLARITNGILTNNYLAVEGVDNNITAVNPLIMTDGVYAIKGNTIRCTPSVECKFLNKNSDIDFVSNIVTTNDEFWIGSDLPNGNTNKTFNVLNNIFNTNNKKVKIYLAPDENNIFSTYIRGNTANNAITILNMNGQKLVVTNNSCYTDNDQALNRQQFIINGGTLEWSNNTGETIRIDENSFQSKMTNFIYEGYKDRLEFGVNNRTVDYSEAIGDIFFESEKITFTDTNQADIDFSEGDLVIKGKDGTMRKIVFNQDGTCSWH